MPVLTTTTARQDIVARLIAAGTAAGSRVYDSRTAPVFFADLPALVVVDGATQDEPRALSIPSFRRTYTAIVGAFVTGATDAALGSALDSLIEECRAALLTSSSWASQYETFSLSTSAPDFGTDDKASDRLARQSLSVQMEWDVAYTYVAPEDDFTTVAVTVEGGADGTDGDEVSITATWTVPT